jgi:hypothetical protein
MKSQTSVTAVSTPAGSSGQLSYSLELRGVLPYNPRKVFDLLTLGSDNNSVFRDIKKEKKHILSHDVETGTKISRIEQEGVIRVFPGRDKPWQTILKVKESKDYVYTFGLIESDLLSALNGSWSLSEVEKSGTQVVLLQNLTPKGIPPFLRRIPFVQKAIKRMLVNTALRQFEDLERACKAEASPIQIVAARA